MPEQEAATPGLFVTVRRLACTFLAILQNRLELASIETRQETRRLVAILVGGAIAVAALFLGMIALMFFFTVAFWPQAVWVMLGFAVFYLIVTVSALLYVRKRLKEPLFPETINQLKKDKEWLFPSN